LQTYGDIPVFTNGCGMLGYLVTLGKIGIEVILACEVVSLFNFTMTGQPQFDRIFDSFSVHLWQAAWMTECDRAYLGIGRRTIGNAVTAKQFAFGEQLRMHLESYHYFV